MPNKKASKNFIDEGILLEVYQEIKNLLEEYNLTPLEAKLVLEIVLDEITRVMDYIESKELSKLDEAIAMGDLKSFSSVA